MARARAARRAGDDGICGDMQDNIAAGVPKPSMNPPGSVES
jgi:hypothetical protein